MAKTTLTVDVYYDARRTDPESLACAMDRLLETVLSTPGIMDEHANPRVGKFFVVNPVATDMQRYTLQIDGGLLRQQRLLLLTLLDSFRRNVPMAPSAQDAGDLLEGISALLDEIADQGHDQYGIDCLLEDQEEESQDQTANPGHQ
jgi:hypothetical protein